MKISEANRLRILYFLVFCCTAAWLPIINGFLKDNGITGWRNSLVLAITPVMSLFYNTVQPILDSLSLKLAQNDPKFSYGKLRVAGAAGWALTGIVTGYLIDASNTTVIFLVAAVCMFLTFLFALPLKTEGTKQEQSGLSFEYVGKLLKNKTLVFLLVCVTLVSFSTSVIWYFYSIYMKDNNASAALVGYGISLQGLCELPLFYFSAVIIGRLGMKTTLLITIFVSVLRMLLYSVVKDPQAALAIELLHGISWSLFWAVCVEFVNSLVPEGKRVTGQSLLYAAYYGAGTIAGNTWTNYLSETHMKVSEVFLLNAGIVFIVGLMVLFFLKKKPIQ